MEGKPHAHDRLGEYCPDCGTHHRVLESIPDIPLTEAVIEDLERADGVHFAREVGMGTGGFYGQDTEEHVTEDIVLSTESSSFLLGRYEDVGWVVEDEIVHEADDVPAEVGEDLWIKASAGFADALSRVFGRG